jgi:integrase
MVIKVTLRGLRIQHAKGRWYVYFRDGGGPPLLKGFEGTREQLLARLGEADMLTIYNMRRKRDLTAIYAEGTLGTLVAWFKTDCPRWGTLSDATRKDYEAAFEWLRPEFDCPLDLITTPALYDVRDRCAKATWPRFADKMIAALSSMFTQAVKRSKMLANPCLGMDRAHKADPNANREWTREEFEVVKIAPLEIQIPMMLARYAGLRSQTIVVVTWKQYQPHPLTGMCFRFTAAKNREKAFVPVMPELQELLAGLKVRTSDGPIALRDDGTPWPHENAVQKRVSEWLRAREREGMVGAGTTLHGLRVTYAAWLRRAGADTREVASALGDKSTQMGEHYTRHVETENNVVRAFTKVQARNDQRTDPKPKV